MKITSNQVQDCILARMLHGNIQYINCPGSGRVGKIAYSSKGKCKITRDFCSYCWQIPSNLTGVEILDKKAKLLGNTM